MRALPRAPPPCLRTHVEGHVPDDVAAALGRLCYGEGVHAQADAGARDEQLLLGARERAR